MLFIVGMGQCALGKMQSARQSFAQGISLAEKSGLKELAAAMRVFDDAFCAARLAVRLSPGR